MEAGARKKWRGEGGSCRGLGRKRGAGNKEERGGGLWPQAREDAGGREEEEGEGEVIWR